MQIIRQAGLVPAPWKNGGGITREALRRPPTGAHYAWRLSFAQVDASGPFSDFSGYTRYLVLMHGGGITLDFADGSSQTLTQPGDLAQFDGGMATHGKLLNGSCGDLNLIVARKGCSAQVRVAQLQVPLALAPAAGMTWLAVPVDAVLAATDPAGEAARLAPGDCAVGHALTLEAPSPCRVFIAGITDNTP